MPGADLGLAASSLASLLVILGVLAAAAVLLRRFQAGASAKSTISPITLIAARPIGGQHRLLIVEADGQRFLIGASRNGLAALGRLSPHD